MLRFMLASAVLACQLAPASAQSLLDKARRDEVATVRSDNAAMNAAMARARAELDAFLGIAEAPLADTRDFSVKIRLPITADSNEYIWIRAFARDGSKFVGTVASTPRNFTNLAHGDRLAFERKDIVDWSYRKGEQTKGNYTACALLQQEAPQQREAFRKRYGLDCSN